MKKIICAVLMLLCLGIACAQAQSIVANTYTDVPSVMTQDAVLSLTADQDCTLDIVQPEERAMALLQKVYTFVFKDGNRPVRYYDEETQRKIEALVPGVDIDILHMTEFFSQHMEGAPLEPVKIQMCFDVEYEPGQLIVVVLGIEQEDGEYRWFPYRGNVPKMGQIDYEVPVEEYEALKGQRVVCHVLTDRIGARGYELGGEEGEPERRDVFSKDAEDLNRVHRWHSTGGTPVDEWFRLYLVERTKPMLDETMRIGEHLETGLPVIAWFPQYIQDQAQLLMPQGVDVRDLLAYDIVAVRAENYQDTYGDVDGVFTFATAYDPERSMVVIAGFPIEDAVEAPYLTWYCLRAEALEEDEVGIDFKQLILPQMEEEPLMVIVLSEPLDTM